MPEMMTGFLVFVLGGSVAAGSSPVSQGLELDISELMQVGTVVTSATKVAQRVEDAPALIDVVTASEIRSRGYTTVGEAVRHLTGLALIDDQVNLNVGVRGVFASPEANSEIIKVMINGIPVTFHATSSQFLGYELLPIEIVEQIEVIRGPASALYGANAFLGVINVITKKPVRNRFYDHQGTVTLSTIGTRNAEANTLGGGGSFSLMGDMGKLNYLIAGSLHHLDRSGLVLPGRDEIRVGGALYPSPGFSFRQNLGREDSSENDLGRPKSVYARFEFETLGKIVLDFGYQHLDRMVEFNHYSLLSHESRAGYYNRYSAFTYLSPRVGKMDFRFLGNMSEGRPLATEVYSLHNEGGKKVTRVGGSLGHFVSLEGYFHGDETLVTVGMDLARRREDLFQLLYPELSGEDIDFGQEVFRNIGFYGQLLWNPYRWMGVTAGVRGDINNMSPCNAEDSSCLGVREDEVLELSRLDRRLDDMELTDRGLVQMSSRLGVVLKPGVRNGYVKLLYGSSFKPPSSYQLYHRPWALEGATAGNPALYPQTADTVELIVGAEVLEGVNVRLNAYRTEATDIVISVREGADVENRNADMESTGLEFELKGEISSQLSFFLNGSYLLDATVTPKRDKGESEAAWAAQPGINRTVAAGKFPGVVLNGGMECRFSEQVLGFVGFNHVGTRSASLVNNTLYNSSLSSTYRFEPYTLVDVNLLVKGMEMVEFRDTSVGLSLRYPLTDYSQPGEGGIDLPSLGPQLYLNLRQEL